MQRAQVSAGLWLQSRYSLKKIEDRRKEKLAFSWAGQVSARNFFAGGSGKADSGTNEGNYWVEGETENGKIKEIFIGAGQKAKLVYKWESSIGRGEGRRRMENSSSLPPQLAT